MKMTVLVENTAPEGLGSEWGLCILAEYEGKKYLLDTGASSLFSENAKKLGVDLSEVDYGILSHAHFDHACGMQTFFDINEKAPFLISSRAEENCYTTGKIFPRYIGMKKGTLKKYRNRITRVEGDYQIEEGVFIVPHKLPQKEQICTVTEKMYVRHGFRFGADDFSHEQSVVFMTHQGMVIVNGCCHGGVDRVIEEVQMTFPGQKICAVIGGFHLYTWSREDVQELSKRLRELDVAHIYTGHCTGKRAFQVLCDELGQKVEALTTGKVFSFQ